MEVSVSLTMFRTKVYSLVKGNSVNEIIIISFELLN